MAVLGILKLVGYLKRPTEENAESNDFSIGLTMIIVSITVMLNCPMVEIAQYRQLNHRLVAFYPKSR